MQIVATSRALPAVRVNAGSTAIALDEERHGFRPREVVECGKWSRPGQGQRRYREFVLAE
jgi:hypothetical protein